MASIARLYERLASEIETATRLAAGADEALAARREGVSGWSVGEHLCHLAKADLVTFDRLDELVADAEGGEAGRATLVGRIVLATGFIPRGVGKAPKATRPDAVAPDEVRAAVAEASRRLAKLEPHLDRLAACRRGARHPYFGVLTPPQWLRFLAVHHRHHGKIVDAISR